MNKPTTTPRPPMHGSRRAATALCARLLVVVAAAFSGTAAVVLGADDGPLPPVGLQFSANDGVVTGFDRLAWDGVTVAAGNLCGRLQITSGNRRFSTFRVAGTESRPGAYYAIDLKAVGDGVVPSVRLEVEALRARLCATEWRGFRYRYRLKDVAPDAELTETRQWHRSDMAGDATYWIRTAFMATEYVTGHAGDLSLPPAGNVQSRFAKTIPFDFHDGEGKALLVYPEEIALILNRTVASGGAAPDVEDTFVLAAGELTTTWKRVLWNDAWPGDRLGRINRFNALWLELRTYYRERAGLGPAPVAEPFVVLGPRLDMVEAALPRAHELGFRRVGIGPIWTSSATEGGGRSAMSVYDFTVAQKLGGPERVQALCQAAAKEGVEIMAWLPCFHLSDQSPLLARHPEWMGKPSAPGLYRGKLLPLDVTNAELRSRLLKQLQVVRDAGVAGFWLDSFHNFAAEVVSDHGDGRRPALGAALGVVRELEGMGFVLYAEALTPFAISSCGLLPSRTAYYRGAEYRLPRGGLYVGEETKGSKLDDIDYFAFLAFGSPLMLYANLWPGKVPFAHFTPAQQAALARWNRQYDTARPEMKRLGGLILGGKAVLWEGGGARIVFALDDCALPVGAAGAVVDLESGTTVAPTSGPMQLSRQTVYRLEGTAGVIE